MYDHWHLRSVDKSLKYRLLFGWKCVGLATALLLPPCADSVVSRLFLISCFVIAIGTFLMVSGTYGSIVDIINAYHKNGGTTVSLLPSCFALLLSLTHVISLVPFPQPFSCEDNSQ